MCVCIYIYIPVCVDSCKRHTQHVLPNITYHLPIFKNWSFCSAAVYIHCLLCVHLCIMTHNALGLALWREQHPFLFLIAGHQPTLLHTQEFVPCDCPLSTVSTVDRTLKSNCFVSVMCSTSGLVSVMQAWHILLLLALTQPCNTAFLRCGRALYCPCCLLSNKCRACHLASGTHDVLFFCTVTVYCPCYLLCFHQAQQFILQMACVTCFIFLHCDCTLPLLRFVSVVCRAIRFAGGMHGRFYFSAQWPYAVPSVLFCFHRV